jgi:hypothetical protein
MDPKSLLYYAVRINIGQFIFGFTFLFCLLLVIHVVKNHYELRFKVNESFKKNYLYRITRKIAKQYNGKNKKRII